MAVVPARRGITVGSAAKTPIKHVPTRPLDRKWLYESHLFAGLDWFLPIHYTNDAYGSGIDQKENLRIRFQIWLVW